jgi:hypothetical protein
VCWVERSETQRKKIPPTNTDTLHYRLFQLSLSLLIPFSLCKKSLSKLFTKRLRGAALLEEKEKKKRNNTHYKKLV